MGKTQQLSGGVNAVPATACIVNRSSIDLVTTEAVDEVRPAQPMFHVEVADELRFP